MSKYFYRKLSTPLSAPGKRKIGIMEKPRWMDLTPGQLDFWEEFLAHPQEPVSTVAHLTRIEGAVDEAALAQAIRAVGDETDVLSLRFAVSPRTGAPIQRVDPANRPLLRHMDLRDQADPEGRARAMMADDLARPLDLCGPDLGAMWLLRTGDSVWLWYCRGHHIFLDGYAMALIERRVAQLYAHLTAGAPAGRPFARLADYLAEEDGYRNSDRHRQARDFWRQRLAAGPLPARLRKGSEDYPAHPRSASVDLGHLAAPLRRASLRHGLGWPDLLIALTALWLNRNGCGPLSSGERILWLPLMGRMGSVGALVPAMVLNIVPWHLPPVAGASLAPALSTLATDLALLRRHGRCRIEQIAADAGLGGGERFFFSPLVNVMPFDPAVFPGCDSRREVLAAGPGDGFNVTVIADSRAANMVLHLDADPDLTDETCFGHHRAGLPRFLEAALDGAGDAALSDLLAVPA